MTPPAASAPVGRIRVAMMAAMVADHAGALWHAEPLRWIGRLCFPLVAALLAIGEGRSADRGRYAARLLVLAILSQPIYAAVLGAGEVNPLFQNLPLIGIGADGALLDRLPLRLPSLHALFWLPVGVAAMAAIRARRWGALAALSLAAALIPADYGLYGYATILLWHLRISGRIGGAGLVAGIALIGLPAWGALGPAQAVIPLLAPLLARALASGAELRLPRWVWWGFYPAHLLLLGAARAWIG